MSDLGLDAVTTPGRRLVSAGLTAAVLALAYLFIFLPVVVLVLFSFHDGKVPVPPFQGPTLAWYEAILGNSRLMAATGHSVLIGVVSAFLSTLLGFLAAFGLARHTVPFGAVLRWLLVLPLTVSYLIIGIGLLIALASTGLPKSLVAVVVGHVVINLPLAFAICYSQLGGHQVVFERAARDLGASEAQVLLWVTVPMIWPALFASFCLCFTFSWDEFVIAFFLSSFDVTLPVEIWSMLRTGLNPTINAAGTLVFLLSLASFLGFEMLLFGRRASWRGRAPGAAEPLNP